MVVSDRSMGTSTPLHQGQVILMMAESGEAARYCLYTKPVLDH